MHSIFSQLVNEASQQHTVQRLLFLFVDPQGESEGTLTPVMCVDKDPAELTDYASLVSEADAINKQWQFTLIAALGGSEQQPPEDEIIEQNLNKMIHDINEGMHLDRYMIIDRDENQIELVAQNPAD